MKRSRLGQIGSWGSKRRKCCHRQYATGARAIGVPGCPELAAWTASIDNVRIVLMHVESRSMILCMIVLRLGRGLLGGERRLADQGCVYHLRGRRAWNHLVGHAAEQKRRSSPDSPASHHEMRWSSDHAAE